MQLPPTALQLTVIKLPDTNKLGASSFLAFFYCSLRKLERLLVFRMDGRIPVCWADCNPYNIILRHFGQRF